MNEKLKSGLYEEVINTSLSKELKNKAENQKNIKTIDKEDASDVLSVYLKDVIYRGLNALGEDTSHKLELINKIVALIRTETDNEDFASLTVPEPQQLLAYIDDMKDERVASQNDFRISSLSRPLTPLSRTTLFTGAKGDPQMFEELKREIPSSDRIDMLVSFIKWSGLRQIINELSEYTEHGGMLRVISTSYMGATDVKAIEELSKLQNTEIKISYDTKQTRLHAKAYLFHRDSGFGTAYVGSSNLSKIALSSGLEWNLKITQKDQETTFSKISQTFESYWNSDEFENYDSSSLDRFRNAIQSERNHDTVSPTQVYTLEIRPFFYQKEILDELDAERKIRNNYRNLVVAATGTGKTVISALDYRRFVRENPKSPSRLLFVAHRREILQQSLNTFRQVLRDANFGEMLTGNDIPERLDYLFVSIQSFNSKDLTARLGRDFYDYIVVDEFHHAAASSYQKLLEYFQPKILLGLTATPERMDGRNVLEYFNNRIAAEIRLPEAIDRKLLCPFQYFGVADGTDLSTLKWTKGSYDKTELSNLYSINRAAAGKRASLIVKSLETYLSDIDETKGLGFCVSVEHARFMEEYFNNSNIPSMSLTGDDSEEKRNTAKQRLVQGEVKFIFVVDIYNEGVDIPEVNTVLFLRPTESLTVFLQQLGRGLRLSEDKECLTVLDYIGQSNQKYNFMEKFEAISRKTGKSFRQNLEDDFIPAPTGCSIQLEKVARETILKTVKASYSNVNGLVRLLSTFTEDTGKELCLSSFLDHYQFSLLYIYSRKETTFSSLLVRAGIRENFSEKIEENMYSAFPRFSYADSREWITFLLSIINRGSIDFDRLTENEILMLKMFYITIWNRDTKDFGSEKTKEDFNLLFNSPVMLSELKELLEYRYSRIDFVDKNVDLGFRCPLAVHASYTKNQILTALGVDSPNNIREGVKEIKEKKLDVFFVTLNKSDKEYSASTMYKDYSINEALFHWESQNKTTPESAVGQRYIHHAELGYQILLFVREDKEDEYGVTEPYTFLGKAQYVSHEGSKPMSIIWKLEEPIPPRFINKTNRLLAM